MLLDSDCIPVSLFEIDELWALTSQALTLPQAAEQQGEADGPAQKARKTKKDDDEDNLGQRVILVTEPHTNINAGLVIILSSDHDSPIDLANAAELAAKIKMSFGMALRQKCLDTTGTRHWATSATTMTLYTARLRNKARSCRVDSH